MAEYELTKKAVGDLNGIWLYSAEVWSKKSVRCLLFQSSAMLPDVGRTASFGYETERDPPRYMGIQS